MECPYCGAILPDDAGFCSECGSPLAAPSPTAPVSEDPYTTPQTVSQSPAFSWRDGEAATAATVELPKADDASETDEQPVAAPGASEPAASESDSDATRVVDPLSDFGTTIEDVETEPACHADFGSTPLSEEEQLEQDRESLKTAKAEYKLARKRLGKSYAPAIAAGVIVVAALCAGTGWAGYSYGLAHPQNTEQIQKLKKQLESSKDELTKTQDELDQTKSDLKDAKAELKTASKNGEDASSDAEDFSTTGNATSSTTTTSGSTAKLNIDKPTSFVNTTWRGALKETGNSWGHTCYGASKNDLVIVLRASAILAKRSRIFPPRCMPTIPTTPKKPSPNPMVTTIAPTRTSPVRLLETRALSSRFPSRRRTATLRLRVYLKRKMASTT